MTFVGHIIGALFDPLAIAGYLFAGLAGVWAKRLSVALVLAIVWATMMEFISQRLAVSLGYEYVFSEFLLARVIGGLAIALLVVGIVALFRAKVSAS